MALTFPSSPVAGQTYVTNGRTWQWDGYAWGLVATGGNYTASGLTVEGGRTLLRAASEPFSVGASYGSGGGYVYFGATHASLTPNAQISNSGGVALMTLLNGGNVGIGAASPATKLDVSGAIRASSGILFGTDTAQANTLYDYEEGLWTPAFLGGFTAISVTSSGQYVKIGRMVMAQARLSVTSCTGNASAPVTVSAPFAASSGSIGSGFVYYMTSVFNGGMASPPLLIGPDSGTAGAIMTAPDGSALYGSRFNPASWSLGYTLIYRAD